MTDFRDLLGETLDQKLGRSSSCQPSPTVQMGTNADSGEELSLSIADMGSTHTYVLGGSGTGKTKFLESTTRDIIKEGYGVIVLDGKAGETCLYEGLVDYCASLDLNGYRLARKMGLIDPNISTYSFGLNYLQPLGTQTPAALSGLVVEAFKKFHKEDAERQPYLDEWLPTSVLPLIKAGFTLLELFHFLNLQEPQFRDAVIAELDEGFCKTKWETLRGFKPNEQAMILNSIRTRATTFWQSPILKAIFGQQHTTIDWLKVMNEGGIVLAKLGTTPVLPEPIAGLIGTAILHQVSTIASLRPKNQRKPFFFVVDEFQRFVTPDFADGLERLREYGISFILAHQHRDQFKQKAPEILNSIDSCCLNKIIFGCSRPDAEDMAADLFTGLIHEGAKAVKDEIWQTKYRPVKTYEEIVSRSESHGHSHTSMSSSGGSFGTSTTNVDGGSIVTNILGNVSGAGSADTVSHSVGKSVSRVPVIDHEEYQEVSSRTYPSVEEVKEEFIAQVKNQPARHIRWKFKATSPVHTTTPWIESALVTEPIRQRFKQTGYENCALPTARVLEEVDERVPNYLKQIEKSGLSEDLQDPKDDEFYV